MKRLLSISNIMNLGPKVKVLVLPLIFSGFLLLTQWDRVSRQLLVNRLNVVTISELQNKGVLEADCYSTLRNDDTPLEDEIFLSQSNAVQANALAWRYWLRGDCQSAIHLWSNASIYTSTRPMSYFWSGIAHMKIGDVNSAVGWFQKAQAGKWLLEKGRTALNIHDNQTAQLWLDLTRQVAPSRDSIQLLVSLNRDDPDYVSSVWLEWANQHSPADVEYWYALGSSAAIQQDWPTAAEYYGNGAVMENADLAIIRQARIAAAQAGKQELEQAMILRGLDIAPDTIPPLLDAANFFLQRNQLDQALYYVQQASRLDETDDNWQILHVSGRIRCAENDYETAKLSLTQARALSNYDLFVSRDLAWCSFRHGQHELALLQIQEANGYSSHTQREQLLAATLLSMAEECLQNLDFDCARLFLTAALDYPSAAERAALIWLQNDLGN